MQSEVSFHTESQRGLCAKLKWRKPSQKAYFYCNLRDSLTKPLFRKICLSVQLIRTPEDSGP